MKIFERSSRNLFKDPAKIFAKILQDLQGFYQDLARILGKIPQGSLLGSFKILEDSMRIFQRSLRYLSRILQGSLVRSFRIFKDLIKILQRSVVRSQKDLWGDPSRSLRILWGSFKDLCGIFWRTLQRSSLRSFRIFKDFIKILQRSLVRSQKDLW